MKTFIILTILILPICTFAQVDNTDWQFWNETIIQFPLSKSKPISGEISGNLRFTKDASSLTDKRIAFGVDFKRKKWLSIKPSYLFRVQTGSGATLYEHRLRFDVTPSKNFKHFGIENRSRFEQDFKTANRADSTFYRNRTKIKFPIKINGKTKFTPYVSNETFFEFQSTSLHRNDSSVGLAQEITDTFGLEYLYQYRRNLESGIKNIHVVGINVRIKLK